LVENRRFN